MNIEFIRQSQSNAVHEFTKYYQGLLLSVTVLINLTSHSVTYVDDFAYNIKKKLYYDEGCIMAWRSTIIHDKFLSHE